MDVCVLTLSDGDEDDSQATIYKTHAEAQTALYKWCREHWASAMEDEGAEWPHGEPPTDDEEMYEEFRDWASEHDFGWHLYRDVPLPE